MLLGLELVVGIRLEVGVGVRVGFGVGVRNGVKVQFRVRVEIFFLYIMLNYDRMVFFIHFGLIKAEFFLFLCRRRKTTYYSVLFFSNFRT